MISYPSAAHTAVTVWIENTSVIIYPGPSDDLTLGIVLCAEAEDFLLSLPSLDLCASTATLLKEFLAAVDLVLRLPSCVLPSLFVAVSASMMGALEENEIGPRFFEQSDPTE